MARLLCVDAPRAPALPDSTRARRPRAAGDRGVSADRRLQRDREPGHADPPGGRRRASPRCRGRRAGRPRGPAPRAGRSPGRHHRAAHARAVRPLPPLLPQPRRDPEPVRRADVRAARRRPDRAAADGPDDRRPRRAAASGRPRHPRALPRRPHPRDPRGSRTPAGRGRGRHPAGRPRRRGRRPRPRRPGGGQLRRRGLRGRRASRAWCWSSPASPAAASPRSPGR